MLDMLAFAATSMRPWFTFIRDDNMSKTSLFLCITFILVLLQFSCKEGATNNYYEESPSQTTSYNVVTSAPTSIIAFADMTNVLRGTVMKLRVNRKDFEVWEISVVFDAVYTLAPDRLILCHTQNGFPVGAGDSGSPLLTSDGRVAGILCYGYEGNSTDFAARAIEDVLSIDTTSALLPASPSIFNTIPSVYVVAGYDAAGASKYPRLGSILGKYTIQTGKPFTAATKLSKTVDNIAIPGSSIAVMYISGDYVSEVAVGTMSYSANGTAYAFGHSYQPFLAAPTYLASTGSFISSTIESFKMSAPSSQLVGSFVKDNYDGVLIKQSVQPLVAQVNTTCSINGKNIFSYHHQISNTPDFAGDKDLAADLSSYLIYEHLVELGKEEDSTTATCNAQIVTDRDSVNASFILQSDYIDGRIYYYLVDSVLTASNSKELKRLNLSADLKF